RFEQTVGCRDLERGSSRASHDVPSLIYSRVEIYSEVENLGARDSARSGPRREKGRPPCGKTPLVWRACGRIPAAPAHLASFFQLRRRLRPRPSRPNISATSPPRPAPVLQAQPPESSSSPPVPPPVPSSPLPSPSAPVSKGLLPPPAVSSLGPPPVSSTPPVP